MAIDIMFISKESKRGNGIQNDEKGAILHKVTQEDGEKDQPYNRRFTLFYIYRALLQI